MRGCGMLMPPRPPPRPARHLASSLSVPCRSFGSLLFPPSPEPNVTSLSCYPFIYFCVRCFSSFCLSRIPLIVLFSFFFLLPSLTNPKMSHPSHVVLYFSHTCFYSFYRSFLTLFYLFPSFINPKMSLPFSY